MILRITLSLVLTTAFAIAVEYLVGWAALLRPWSLVKDHAGISIAIGFLAVTYLTRALRLYRYFRLPSGFENCLRLQLYHLAFVNLMPFRSGELAFPVLMRRYFGTSLPDSVGGLFWLRGLDLHVLLTIAVFFVGMMFWGPLVAAAGTVLWLATLVAVYFVLKKSIVAISRAPRTVHRVLRFAEASSPRSPARFIEAWALTVINWGAKIVALAWLFHAFVSESYWYSIAAVTAGELSAVLPIQGIGGFGTYEAAILAATSMFKVSTDAALVGAVNVHLFALSTSVFVAFATFLLSRARDHALGSSVRSSELQPCSRTAPSESLDCAPESTEAMGLRGAVRNRNWMQVKGRVHRLLQR